MPSNGLRLLKVAEYTSLAASVAGVVISTASKQVVYAAAPLSISIFLNLLNRQRFEQQTQQSLTTTTAQVEQQLSQLNRGFSRLQQEVRNELNQQIQALDVRVTSSQPAQVNLPYINLGIDFGTSFTKVCFCDIRIRCNKPDLVKNQKIEWSANVGVPVEYCDSPAIARFKKVLSLAWLLSNEPQTELFTLESLGQRLDQLRSRIADNPIDCHAIPEISAEVWSCLNSREFDDGFYTFFDVGCGTLDGVSFRYWRDQGEPKVDFYSAVTHQIRQQTKGRQGIPLFKIITRL
jgi:hypothetical protein